MLGADCGARHSRVRSAEALRRPALIVPQYDLMSDAMTRRPTDPRAAAEAAFKAATAKPAELPPKQPSMPGAKELVSLRIDRDVLDYFQEGGPGWQERINAALRKAAGK
jgi:uncharacterized protein (DUF4415 family)